MTTIFKNKKELIETFIGSGEVVLDVGFWGQAVKIENPNWSHRLLLKRAKEVYGVDLDYDESKVTDPNHYLRASAENFSFNPSTGGPKDGVDVIFAGDLIEHLSNPGLFIEQTRKHLKTGGKLVITTPNAFSLFSLLSKVLRDEPPVNPDHTMYFNKVVLAKLLEKNGFRIIHQGYISTFPSREGFKRTLAYLLYRLLFLFTKKFSETLVVVATPR